MEQAQKHSGLGIASFVIAVVAGVLMFASFVAAGVMEATTPGGIDESSLAAVLLGLGMIFLAIVDLVAAGLGIAGLLQKGRRKLFPVLGLALSAAAVLAMLVLMLVGSMM